MGTIEGQMTDVYGEIRGFHIYFEPSNEEKVRWLEEDLEAKGETLE